jgi:hypothetical protein
VRPKIWNSGAGSFIKKSVECGAQGVIMQIFNAMGGNLLQSTSLPYCPIQRCQQSTGKEQIGDDDAKRPHKGAASSFLLRAWPPPPSTPDTARRFLDNFWHGDGATTTSGPATMAMTASSWRGDGVNLLPQGATTVRRAAVPNVQ